MYRVSITKHLVASCLDPELTKHLVTSCLDPELTKHLVTSCLDPELTKHLVELTKHLISSRQSHKSHPLTASQTPDLASPDPAL